MKPELRLVKTLWGLEDQDWDETLFRSIKEEGYYGVEYNRVAWTLDGRKDNYDEEGQKYRDEFVRKLNAAELGFVCQIHTTGGYIDKKSGEYVYCGSYNVKDHKNDFTKQLKECVKLLSMVKKGGFVNVHGGLDAWTDYESVDFLKHCFDEIENSCPVTVTFETHRQRVFGDPFQTRRLLSSFPKEIASSPFLKFNADLSHWYVSCERVFDSTEQRDAVWWPRLLRQVADRTAYIHARFGFSQGSQMSDPSAPENDRERNLQLNVWKTLMENQRKRHPTYSILASPEYGPAPYLPVVPRTLEPVSPISDAISYTKGLLEDLYENSIS